MNEFLILVVSSVPPQSPPFRRSHKRRVQHTIKSRWENLSLYISRSHRKTVEICRGFRSTIAQIQADQLEKPTFTR
jgi:hypothetical protein